MDLSNIVGVGIFLIVSFAIGMRSGRKVTTFKQYALGDRKFSDIALVSTIVATWVCGTYFAVFMSEIYTKGLPFLLAALGYVFALLFTSFIVASRAKQFLGSYSIADVTGKLFGSEVRWITAIGSIAMGIGLISAQLKLLSLILSSAMKIDANYMLFISSAVVIIYSASGGVRAVTFTDMVQFAAFGVGLPLLVIHIYTLSPSTQGVEDTGGADIFSFSHLININKNSIYFHVFFFLYAAIPALSPTMFQRILLAKNEEQIKSSFAISAIVSLFIYICVAAVSILLYYYKPNLKIDNIFIYLMMNILKKGFQLIALISIISMIMSTVDSWLNTSSIIIAHDIVDLMGIKKFEKLDVARGSVYAVGILAVGMAILGKNLLKVLLLASNFYKPIVLPSLLLFILGFRANRPTVIVSIFFTAITIVLWRIYIQPVTDIDSLIPGFVTNLFFILTLHILRLQRGEWVTGTIMYKIVNGDINIDLAKVVKGTYKK